MANPTALVPARRGTSLALAQDLADKARDFAVNAHSEKTRHEYARCWRKFSDWCDAHGAPSLPTTPGTLAAYMTWLADGQAGSGARGARWADGHKLSNSSLNQTMSAIKYTHRMKGVPFGERLKGSAVVDADEARDWAALRQVLDGIRRTIGQSRMVRRVKPLTATELRDIIEMLRPNVLREARDAAVLATGFGACRRRSEVVGLNYMERDPKDKGCKGTLSIEDKGVIIRLSQSKTNQSGRDEEYVIPRAHAALLCNAIQNWVDVAKIQKGQPMFLAVPETGHSKSLQSGYPGVYWVETRSGKGQWVAKVRGDDGKLRTLPGRFGDDARAAHLAWCSATGVAPSSPFAGRSLGGRITGGTVARIVQRRFGELLRAQMGRKKLRPEDKASIKARVAEVSGHSMRVGHITSAAENGTPVHHIQLASGHQSPQMIALYTRVTDKVSKSSLKGMGLG